MHTHPTNSWYSEIIEEIFSSHRLHLVPNRIVSTIRRAESTTTRHRDAGHARMADTTRRWCASCQGWATNRSRHHRCQAEALSKNSTCRISKVVCTVRTVGTRLCTQNKNIHHSVDELKLGRLQEHVQLGLLELVADDRRDVDDLVRG